MFLVIMPVENQELLKQVHFTCESVCEEFKPHRLRASFCTECNKLFSKHKPSAIPNDECLLEALAHSQKAERTPDCILSSENGRGSLYLGGYRGVMNTQFLNESGVSYIVNTAKGLEIFGAKYLESVKKAKHELKVKFLELNWEDTEEWVISDEDITNCVKFVNEGLINGKSVLVHCAQGKSRSSTAVIAYVMVAKHMSLSESYSYVKTRHKMAEPNPHFMKRLEEFEKSQLLQDLRMEMTFDCIQLKKYIEEIPKAELHIHIEGTLEPELMFKLAERNGIKLQGTVESHKERRKNFKDLQDFLDLYYEACNVLKTEEDFYDLMYAYLKKAATNNVRVAEIFFDPQTHTNGPNKVPFKVLICGLHRALIDAQRDFNIKGSLILCFLRHLPQEDHLVTLEEATPYLNKIIGVGLDSGELGNEPCKFVEVFSKASQLGLNIVAHAGEEGGPEYIREALDCLHAQRIDHGVQCLFDAGLVERLIQEQIPLTVCPLSNVKLQVNSRYFQGQNKTKEMLDRGLIVTINSDDPAYFGGYITDNFLATATSTALTREDVYKVCCNAFNATFLPLNEKSEYLAQLKDFNDKYCK